MNPIERKNNLLTKLATKEITMEQFLLACALWAMELECWVDIEVRQYSLPPQEWQEYEHLPLDKRLKISEAFFHQSAIKEYLASKSHIYSANWADYSWCLEYKRIIPDMQENLEYHQRLDQKIIEFERWFKNYTPEIERIKQQFSAEEV